ncbi:hypothetical protein NLI96_g8850 [Meripilus lineatus]|uniref:Uncharacterized protein n=1 Tax=Meripilus lineatus TaxID=2056292 RepID=A0AAD5UYV6_9APHY|nr:hypothetical protein NLI96_g8850 [Physisporinus lineatus]
MKSNNSAASTSMSQPRRSSALKRQSPSETSVIDLVDNPDDDQVDQADSEIVEVNPPEKTSNAIKGSDDPFSQQAGPSKAIAQGGASGKTTLPSPSQKRTREAEADGAPKAKVAKFRREVTTTVQGTSPPELSQLATQKSSAEDNHAEDSNVTYIVNIQYNHSDDYVTHNLFKTRGKHLVSKVLKMACRTFEVTYNPETVRLERIEECTDSFGAPDERRIRCRTDGVMAETGLQQDALYELIVDED